MTDLLVRLYDWKSTERSTPEGVTIRRAFVAEKRLIANWVSKRFGERWASECEVSFMRQPVSCFVAANDYEVLGFAVYDATARGFFGPTGVTEESRHKGIGQALLFATLHDMAAIGYAYAIIGAAGNVQFYEKSVGAIAIANSSPGFYRGMLKS